MLELWEARSLLEGLLEQEGPDQQRWKNGKEQNQEHNIDSTKPANSDLEVEIGGFDMSYFNVDAEEV